MKNNYTGIEKFKELINKISYNFCPECNGACCEHLWVNSLENSILPLFSSAKTINIPGTEAFYVEGRCPNLDCGKCSVYQNRPLDCRLYPIDILYIENGFVWVAYTSCQGHLAAIELFRPYLLDFEVFFRENNFFEEIFSQIKFYSLFWEPLSSENYIIIANINE